jgi:hypothetical protein
VGALERDEWLRAAWKVMVGMMVLLSRENPRYGHRRVWALL